MFIRYTLVAIGGALGSVGRFWMSGLIANKFGQAFPWGTLVINVSGSFVIGFFATLTDTGGRYLVSPDFRTFFMIGVCGGFTTFSSFSLQTLTLAQDGEWLYAGANSVSSLVLCLVAVWLGHVCAMLVNPK